MKMEFKPVQENKNELEYTSKNKNEVATENTLNSHIISKNSIESKNNSLVFVFPILLLIILVLYQVFK